MQRIDVILFRIHAVENREELWQVLFKYFQGIGVQMASYHATRADGTPMKIKADGFPET